MDNSGSEERLFAVGDAKLHGSMYRKLSAVVYKVIEIFPDLEAARPRSKSGIQALCSLHVALDKAKNLLQHCANCSKLYLAITSESVLLKFEKARCSLQDSLRRVEDIVPPSIGSQILDILGYLEDASMELDQSEKQAGDDVIQLLQKEKNFNGEMSDVEELEVFHQAAIRLGITSSRAALTERRALKKLVEKARTEEDKRKESIVAYLLLLMRKYSKLFRSEVADDTDSLGSAPCSPTVMCASEESYGWGGNVHAFDRQLSKLSSFNFKPSGLNSGGMPIPPEELRCPISLQLMYDPVIVSSGQTYERLCIEKWFSDGHQTCPKTQQQLSHLCLTPNYCVKGLITNWCEQNGVPVPQGPPDTLDLNYLRLALSECEATNSRSMESVDSSQLKGMKGVPFEDSTMAEVLERKNLGNLGDSFQDFEANDFEGCGYLLSMLYESKSLRQQKKVVEQIRILLKDDEEARSYMGANGFTEALVQFLSYAVQEGEEKAQETGAMALFNLAVNNDRNKETMLSIGIIQLLEEMVSTAAYESATALYLNLSCYDNAKPVIGSSKAVPFLIQLLWPDACKMQCKADALHCLYNLSTHPPNISFLLSSGIVDALHSLISATVEPSEMSWAEKSMAIFINLASNKSGKKEIISTPGLVGSIASVLDTGEPCEQEQVVSCLLILCSGDQKCCHMVLQEGVIPALVSVSVNGTDRGKEKAQKLLMLFREQRQRDISPVKSQQQHRQTDSGASGVAERKPLCKSASKKMGRLTSLWKNKHFSVYQC